ncbi:MAG: PfkB family carbohydrate kinase [Bifidobacterium pullorum]
MPEVMTIGEPMVNLIADSTETYLEARQLPRQMAGSEFNVAIGVSRQGHSIGYVTQLGDDWQGDLIVDYMNATGIDTSAIRRVSDAATGFQLKVRSSDGEPKVIDRRFDHPGHRGRCGLHRRAHPACHRHFLRTHRPDV